MTHDVIVLNVVSTENGLSCVWVEPVVVRGDVGPSEEKPVAEKPETEQPTFESPSDAKARVAHDGMADVVGSMARAVKAAESQIVYRLVRRAMVFKDGEDIGQAVTAVKRSQRLLNDLNRRGAVAEAAVGPHPAAMPMLMAGPVGIASGGPGRKGRGRGRGGSKKPKPRGKK